MTDQINLNIVDGEPFYAHEVTCNFTPTQMIIDFKCITPRTDPRSKKPTFQLKHNVIMMEPWQAAQLKNVFTQAIQKYEEQFGKIKMPNAIKKVQKERQEKTPEVAAEIPHYMG